MNRAWLSIAVAAWSLGALRASAQTNESPDALIDRGFDLREHGDDAGALRLFTQAYEAGHSPRALAQMGLAEQALGTFALAEQHLADALESASDPWITSHHDVLLAALTSIGQRLGSVQIVTNLPGASISIGGEVVGTTPLAAPLRVQIGTRPVEVSLAGYLTQSISVIVNAGELAQQTVTLLPVPVAPPIVTQEPHGAGVVAPVTPPRPQRPPEPDGGWRTLGWIGYAIGMGSLTVGLFSMFARAVYVGNFNNQCPPPPSGGYSADCLGSWNTGHTFESMAYGFGLGGLALGAAGTTLALTLMRRPDGGWRALGWVGFSLGLMTLSFAGVTSAFHFGISSDPASNEVQRAVDREFVEPISWASWVVGGLLTVGGLVLAVTVGGHVDASAGSRAHLSCAPTAGSLFGVACQGSF